MLFNSLQFALFLPLVFVLYWLVGERNVKLQNLLVLVASYVFYGWWDVRFLALIAFSSLVDYQVGLGLGISRAKPARKLLLGVSLVGNLGLLFFFKYYGFFATSLVEAAASLGWRLHLSSLQVILPVGISFYTFQTLSYTIDVYRGKLAPERDLVAFFAFVGFFPQLVAGPIERAGNLLGQFSKPRAFDCQAGLDGMRQIAWGLFKKIVVADSCAIHANAIFADPSAMSGGTLILGVVYFAFQIYGDFSGYSDIAIGSARLFGFRLMPNFSYPYFSRDIAEFWRRWHISLSSWFRDYLYIPLGGSRRGLGRNLLNTTIIFTVSGLWHGADWRFVVWGLLNAAYFMPLLIGSRNRRHLDTVAAGRKLPSLAEAAHLGATFALVTLAWVFFRAESCGQACRYLAGIFTQGTFCFPLYYLDRLPLIAIMLLIEWPNRNRLHPLQTERGDGRQVFWLTALVVLTTVAFISADANEFIYFQF